MSGDKPNIKYCTFCGKDNFEVSYLIAGPTVFICDQCVKLCCQIMEQEWAAKKAIQPPIEIQIHRLVHEHQQLNSGHVKELAEFRVKDVRGSCDVPGFDACVHEEIVNIYQQQVTKGVSK